MVSGSRARAKGLGLEVTVCRGLEIEYYIINITITIRFAITEHFLCVFFKSRPLLLQLCLLWVSFIIKLPSSQSESISQGLHGSAPLPPAQNHPLWLRSLSVCAGTILLNTTVWFGRSSRINSRLRLSDGMSSLQKAAVKYILVYTRA